MEFGTREILIAIGILVILAILLDGVRRVRGGHDGKLRSRKRKQPIFEELDLDPYGSELPGGGARVVSVRDKESAEQLGETIKRSAQLANNRVTRVFREKPRQPDIDLQDSPLLDAAAQEEADEKEAQPAPPEGSEARAPASIDGAAPGSGEEAPFRATREPEPDMQGDPEPIIPDPDSEPDPESDPEPVAEPRAAQPPRRQKAKETEASARDKRQPVDDKGRAQQPEVLVLHVMAPKGQYLQGEPLLEALLNNNMRYGSMKIFHRHANRDGSGPVLFSAASAVNPGTFDLNAMSDFKTPGLAFFMALDDLEHPMETFDELMEVVRNLARDLGGEVKDETRSAMTRQTVEHYRQRILDFTRRSFTLSH